MRLYTVILAAGLGTRMKSDLPKVLHEALGKPMLQHTIDAVKQIKPHKTVVVVGNGAEEVKKRVDDGALSFALQKKLLGTGDALAAAREHLEKGTILVLNGDCPLITAKTLKGLLAKHRRHKNTLSFLSFTDAEMTGYGRVLRDESGMVTGIVEDKDATAEQKEKYIELNGGVYLLETEALSYLDKIKNNNASGEYYLTDIIGLVAGSGKKVGAYDCPQEEIRGVNSRKELHEISDILRRRVVLNWMVKGVTFIDPATAYVHGSVKIGRDTVIYPNTYIEGTSVIGRNCVIMPGARICDSRVDDGAVVKDSTLVEESRIGKGAVVGPFAHLRPASDIGRNAKIGNFVETKKSRIGEGSKASHLSYLGDADVGKDVNIGAGTITCNYDGKNKFRTTIESGVFVGSDSQLVAPVTIGKGAYVAAGATVIKNVPSGALAISRSEQLNLKDWVKIRKSKSSKKNK